MSKKNLIRSSLIFFAFLVVFYPLWVWYSNATLSFSSIVLFDIFPALGLVGFTVMWLHIVGGPFRKWLESYIDFEKFVLISSFIVLITIILHPLLLFIALAVNDAGSVFSYVKQGDEFLIWIAAVALVIFLAYDIAKLNKTKTFIAKHWFAIKLISTLGFFLVLVHSLGIGRDLQAGPLRIVWYFYGVTAALATIYTYLIVPSRKPLH